MLFSTVATLFCAAVYVLTQGINKIVLGYMAFLPTSLGQYFMVCYYGQLIINKVLFDIFKYSETQNIFFIFRVYKLARRPTVKPGTMVAKATRNPFWQYWDELNVSAK